MAVGGWGSASSSRACRRPPPAQNWSRDRARRIVGEEMHAGDERVLGQHKVSASRRRQQSRIVAQAEAFGPGNRRKETGDEVVFAGAVRHFALS
jgi:hypothetical protein